MTTPYEQGETLDYIVLGATRSPGVVKLIGHDRDQNWDVQAAKGSTGASSTLEGEPVGQFQASFYLASSPGDDGVSDFDRWEDFQRLIESTTSGPKPTALPIYHPDLARNRFTEVSNGGVGGMLHDGRGGATVIVKFIEYRPPKPKPAAKAQPKAGGSSAAGARTGVTTIERPDPNAAAKAKLNELLAEARKP
jgi:hypothetical protein